MTPSVAIDRGVLAEVLRGLIACNSVNPSLVPGAPGEAQIALYVTTVCRTLGLDADVVEAAPGRPNVIATLRGTGGSTAAALRGAPPAGDVVLTFVADEEYASIGAEALARAVTADAAVVTEPTGLAVGIAHKGFAWARFETAGRAAHGSDYQEGRDAIAAMGFVLAELRRLDTNRLAQHRHPILGRASLHASLIAGGEGLSTYPASCVLQVERRTLPGETAAAVEAEMLEVLQRGGGGRVEIVFFGLAPWMDSAILGGVGIPCVIFGPGGGGAHADEEYVELDSAVRCAEVLAALALEFCGRP